MKMANWMELNQTQQKLGELPRQASAPPSPLVRKSQPPRSPSTARWYLPRPGLPISAAAKPARPHPSGEFGAPTGQAPYPAKTTWRSGAPNDNHGSNKPAPALARQVRPNDAQICKTAEAQLARLRSDPNPEKLARLARELSCEALRPEVSSLLGTVPKYFTEEEESARRSRLSLRPKLRMVNKPSRSGPSRRGSRFENRRPQQFAGQPGSQTKTENAQTTCKTAEARLARLRAPIRTARTWFASPANSAAKNYAHK